MKTHITIVKYTLKVRGRFIPGLIDLFVVILDASTAYINMDFLV